MTWKPEPPLWKDAAEASALVAALALGAVLVVVVLLVNC